MADVLKYDTEELDSGRKKIDDLITGLDDARSKMKFGLSQIRSDWDSESGKVFFENIDSDWEPCVQNCIEILDDLSSLLKQASIKYSEITERAPDYLKF